MEIEILYSSSSKFWYTRMICPWNRKMWLLLWDEILYSSFAKFQYIKMTLPMKSKKCDCLYEMKFYNHLQNFGIQEWSCPWNQKVWLPLWDEILYSSSAKFRYARMIVSLKSEKCGCFYEMKFYIHHLLTLLTFTSTWTSGELIIISQVFL